MKNWDDIHLISEIVQRGSLGSAARALNLSHSTLSRRVHALEKRIGTLLFDKRPDGFQPTEAGRRMAEAGQRMAAEADKLSLHLDGLDEAASGVLRVTAPSLLIDRFLAPHLRDFVVLYPEIELHINASEKVLDLARREADVAIRATFTPSPGLFGRKVAEQKRGVFASPSYLAAHRDGQPHDWLAFSWWAEEQAQSAGSGRVVARFDDMLALLASARAGMGVARLPCFIGDADPALVRLGEFELEDYLHFWVLTHPSLKSVTRVRLFMSFVAERFGAERGLFIGAGG